jgi:hypothetical protein
VNVTFGSCSQIQQIVLHNTKPKSSNIKHVIKTTVWRLRFVFSLFLTLITNHKYKKTHPGLPLESESGHTAHVTFQGQLLHVLQPAVRATSEKANSVLVHISK